MMAQYTAGVTIQFNRSSAPYHRVLPLYKTVSLRSSWTASRAPDDSYQKCKQLKLQKL